MPKIHSQTKAARFDRDFPQEFASVRGALLMIPEKLLFHVLQAIHEYGARRAKQERDFCERYQPPE